MHPFGGLRLSHGHKISDALVEIDEKSDRGEAVTQQDFIEGEFIEKGTAAEQYLEAPVVDDEIHENN